MQDTDRNIILVLFFQHLNSVKLLHFQIRIYNYHKILDAYHSKFSETMDKFIEVLSSYERFNFKTLALQLEVPTDDIKILHFFEIEKEIFLEIYKTLDEPALENILQEMLADIMQTIYLLKAI
jgi:hypothetical protein